MKSSPLEYSIVIKEIRTEPYVVSLKIGGIEYGTLSANQVIGPFQYFSKDITQYTCFLIPFKINAGARITLRFPLTDSEGNTVPSSEINGFSIKYNEQGQLFGISLPAHICNSSDNPYAPPVVRLNNKAYHLPIKSGDLFELMSVVRKSNGEILYEDEESLITTNTSISQPEHGVGLSGECSNLAAVDLSCCSTLLLCLSEFCKA